MIVELQEAAVKAWAGHAGMLSGDGLAFGASSLKRTSWKQEIESALLLIWPGMCCTHTLMLWCATQKYSNRTKAMVSGDLHVPFCHTVTTVRLSQLKSIFWRFQKVPQVCAATMIAYNSFQAMLISCCSGDQWSRILLPDQYAPHPSVPEASVYNCIVALSVQWESRIKVLPDQWGKKLNHHCRSNFAFSACSYQSNSFIALILLCLATPFLHLQVVFV